MMILFTCPARWTLSIDSADYVPQVGPAGLQILAPGHRGVGVPLFLQARVLALHPHHLPQRLPDEPPRVVLEEHRDHRGEVVPAWYAHVHHRRLALHQVVVVEVHRQVERLLAVLEQADEPLVEGRAEQQAREPQLPRRGDPLLVPRVVGPGVLGDELVHRHRLVVYHGVLRDARGPRPRQRHLDVVLKLVAEALPPPGAEGIVRQVLVRVYEVQQRDVSLPHLVGDLGPARDVELGPARVQDHQGHLLCDLHGHHYVPVLVEVPDQVVVLHVTSVEAVHGVRWPPRAHLAEALVVLGAA
mmetsp:Transcript_12958/g.30630  ORF Transcript_12958/g.30630 Transcript_12958/m.30630 type:complete len:300 (+) Transcript_12958:162-1061(+)